MFPLFFPWSIRGVSTIDLECVNVYPEHVVVEPHQARHLCPTRRGYRTWVPEHNWALDLGDVLDGGINVEVGAGMLVGGVIPVGPRPCCLC